LQVLVVDREREQRRDLVADIRPVDVGAEADAVAQRHVHVPLLDELEVSGLAVVVGGRLLGRERQAQL
jgi:hypothetical protein